MIDIKKLITNAEEMQQNCINRHLDIDIKQVITLYEQQKGLKQELDQLRAKRNEVAQSMKGKMSPEERSVLIEKGKALKEELGEKEEGYKEVKEEYQTQLLQIPNYTAPDSPIGGEEDSTELKRVGEIRKFDFPVKDHLEIGYALDLLDFEAGAKVAGQKFYFLKNEAVLLELALVQYAIKKVMSKGFIPHITPDMARTSVVEGIGFNPRGESTNIYSIENQDLCMIGTSEITLGGKYADTIFKEEELPLKVAGFSHCFRTEAGGAGRESKGLYRVHQFSKVEMFAICKPEDAEGFLEDFLKIEEEICQELNIPYRVLDIASADLGNPAYKKYDIEAWLPGRDKYGEITSTSNCTDYQSRRLNIKYKNKDNETKFVYMLNGTAIAVPRIIISILENFQNEDGSVDLPEVLHPYMGMKKIERK